MRYRHVAVALMLELAISDCARQGGMAPPPAAGVAPATSAPAGRPPPPRPPPAPSPRVRAVRVDSVRLEAALLERQAHGPLASVLQRRSGNPRLAERTAAAVVRESRRLRLSPSLVAAVILVENAALDTTAKSVAGALGLMQVMPVHGGALGCPSAELGDVESNICHGTRVLHMYLRRSRTLSAALRRYNGCVGGLATRRCLRYPARVLQLASTIRREMLEAPAAAAPPPAAPPRYLERPAGHAGPGAAARDLAVAPEPPSILLDLLELPW